VSDVLENKIVSVPPVVLIKISERVYVSPAVLFTFILKVDVHLPLSITFVPIGESYKYVAPNTSTLDCVNIIVFSTSVLIVFSNFL
jgi:hypothetical protein